MKFIWQNKAHRIKANTLQHTRSQGSIGVPNVNFMTLEFWLH